MLSKWNVRVLAQAFGLGARHVTADAALVAHWRQPSDDLLFALQERHDWPAVRAYRYLRTLRRAAISSL